MGYYYRKFSETALFTIDTCFCSPSYSSIVDQNRLKIFYIESIMLFDIKSVIDNVLVL